VEVEEIFEIEWIFYWGRSQARTRTL